MPHFLILDVTPPKRMWYNKSLSLFYINEVNVSVGKLLNSIKYWIHLLPSLSLCSLRKHKQHANWITLLLSQPTRNHPRNAISENPTARPGLLVWLRGRKGCSGLTGCWVKALWGGRHISLGRHTLHFYLIYVSSEREREKAEFHYLSIDQSNNVFWFYLNRNFF